MGGNYHLKEMIKEEFTGRKSCTGQHGTVLLGLIVTLIILSVLGAAMLSFFTTSTMSQISGNSSMRAYYLAESGFRYADGELANTSMSVRDSKIETLHDTDYTLTNDNGTFHLDMYPFFFKTTADPGGTTILDAKVPGGFPPGLALTSGYVDIDNERYHYSNATQSGSTVTFTRASGNWPSIDLGTTIHSASKPDGNQTINSADNYLDLETSTGSANAFPELNGTFRVSGTSGLWFYGKRSVNRLEGVSPFGDPAWSKTTTLELDGTDDIILDKYVELRSTGIIYASQPLETKRELIYYAPLSESYKIAFHETFDDKGKWTEKKGTFGIGSMGMGGGSALTVTGTASLGGDDTGSLIAFDWAATAINLETVHELAGNFLSYDAQVKVGFDAGTVPNYFAAGISARLDNDENYYGLSFMRGDCNLVSPSDGIPDDIVPEDRDGNKLNGTLMIVLWQQTDSGNDRTWLAYKDVSQRDFSDDVESGTNGWTASELWHISEHRSHSSSHAWYYGQEGTWSYDTGSATTGTVESSDINLCGFSTATLSFWSWYDTEAYNPANPQWTNLYDLKYVQVSTNGGSTWTLLKQIRNDTDPQSTWEKFEIDLSSFVGQIIKLRFYFNTGDSADNAHEGWYIDDIAVTGDYRFPVNEGTLMLRVLEAATVEFTSGGSTEIEAGDSVRQSNGAQGKVVGTPVLSSGSWTSGTAAGIMLLNNLPRKADGSILIPFASGPLNVAGKGVDLATVSTFKAKDNYLRAYYGDTSGCGTPNEEWLDDERQGNPRGEVHWPPDDVSDWSADNDYFTLIQWDDVNPLVTSITTISSVNEPDAILRSSEEDLLSPKLDGFNDPELGLHALGDGATNVYFDDFAIQAEISTKRTGFLPSIQQ